jgi:hypothetical protein
MAHASLALRASSRCAARLARKAGQNSHAKTEKDDYFYAEAGGKARIFPTEAILVDREAEAAYRHSFLAHPLARAGLCP